MWYKIVIKKKCSRKKKFKKTILSQNYFQPIKMSKFGTWDNFEKYFTEPIKIVKREPNCKLNYSLSWFNSRVSSPQEICTSVEQAILAVSWEKWTLVSEIHVTYKEFLDNIQKLKSR